jgi:hypothetical protein
MALLTISDAARVTGVSRVTLHRYIKAGKLSRRPDGLIDTAELLRVGLMLQADTLTRVAMSPLSKEEAAKGPGYIYWVRLGETRYVKIGRALNVTTRLYELQDGSPFPLQVMHTVHVANMENAEQQLHLQFAAYHIRGEWFLFPSGSFAHDTTDTLEAHKASRWADLKREIEGLRTRMRELERQNAYLIQQLNQAFSQQ